MSAFLLANLFTFDGTSVVRYHSLTLFLLLRVPQLAVIVYMALQVAYNKDEIVETFMGQTFMENTVSFGAGMHRYAWGIADPGAGLPARVNGSTMLVNIGEEGAGWVNTIVDDLGGHLFLRTSFYEVREMFSEVDGVWAWRADPSEAVIRSLIVQNVSLFDEISVQTVARFVCNFPQGNLRIQPFGSDAQTHVFSNYKDPSEWINGQPPAEPYDHSLPVTTAREIILEALMAGPQLSREQEDALIEREILACYGDDADPTTPLLWPVEEGDLNGPCLFTKGITLGLMMDFDCNFNNLMYDEADGIRYGCDVSRDLMVLSSSSSTQEAHFIYSSDSNAFVRRKQIFGGIRIELRGSGTCAATTLHHINFFVSAFVSYMLLAYTIAFTVSKKLLTVEAFNKQYAHFDEPPTKADGYFQSWYENFQRSKTRVDLTRRTTDSAGFFDKLLEVVLDYGGEDEVQRRRVKAAFRTAVASTRIHTKIASMKGAALGVNMDEVEGGPSQPIGKEEEEMNVHVVNDYEGPPAPEGKLEEVLDITIDDVREGPVDVPAWTLRDSTHDIDEEGAGDEDPEDDEVRPAHSDMYRRFVRVRRKKKPVDSLQ